MAQLVSNDTDPTNVGVARSPHAWGDVILVDTNSVVAVPVKPRWHGPLVRPDPLCVGAAVAVGAGPLGAVAGVEKGNGVDCSIAIDVKVGEGEGGVLINDVECIVQGLDKDVGETVLIVGIVMLRTGEGDPIVHDRLDIQLPIRALRVDIAYRPSGSQQRIAANTVHQYVNIIPRWQGPIDVV